MSRGSAEEQGGGAATEWFMRVGENSVVGELTLEMLAEWAETGRLTHDSEVSRNGHDWVIAETIPELKMDWLVTLKSGVQHGPMNLLAVPDLYRRGIIDATAVLENKVTQRRVPATQLLRGLGSEKTPAKSKSGTAPIPGGGTTAPVSDHDTAPVTSASAAAASPEASADDASPASDDVAELRERVASLEHELADDKQRVVALKQRLAIAQGRKEEGFDKQQARERIQARLIEERSREASELKARVEQLEDQRQKSQAEHQRRAADLESALAEQRRSLESAQRESAALREELKAAEAARDEAAASADVPQAQSEARAAEGDAARQALEARVQDLEAQLKAATEREQLAARELQTLEGRVRDLEAKLKVAIEREQLAARDLKAHEARAADAERRADSLMGRAAEASQVAREAEVRAKSMESELERAKADLAAAESQRGHNDAASDVLATLVDAGAAIEDAEKLLADLAAVPPIDAATLDALCDPELFLRDPEGTVTGPTRLSVLQAWAADCRVGPDHEVSQDKDAWFKASACVPLGLRWMVTLVDGTRYGPINIFAMRDFIKDTVVAPDAKLRHVDTGMEYDLQEALFVETQDANSARTGGVRAHIDAILDAVLPDLTPVADARRRLQTTVTKLKTAGESADTEALGALPPPRAVHRIVQNSPAGKP